MPLNEYKVTVMKYQSRSLIVGLLVVTLLSGCATKEADDAMKTKAEGTILGAAGSMAASSLLGSVIGGKRKRIRFERAIDVLFGGSGGYVLGTTVAERKQRYANEEARLEGEIKLFNLQNERLNTYNTATAKEITDLQQKLADIALQKEETRKQATFSAREKEKYSKKIATDQVNRVKLASELAALEEYFQSIQGTGDQSKVASLRQEIETLQKNTTLLESNNRQMDQLVAAMPVRN